MRKRLFYGKLLLILSLWGLSPLGVHAVETPEERYSASLKKVLDQNVDMRALVEIRGLLRLRVTPEEDRPKYLQTQLEARDWRQLASYAHYRGIAEHLLKYIPTLPMTSSLREDLEHELLPQLRNLAKRRASGGAEVFISARDTLLEDYDAIVNSIEHKLARLMEKFNKRVSKLTESILSVPLEIRGELEEKIEELRVTQTQVEGLIEQKRADLVDKELEGSVLEEKHRELQNQMGSLEAVYQIKIQELEKNYTLKMNQLEENFEAQRLSNQQTLLEQLQAVSLAEEEKQKLNSEGQGLMAQYLALKEDCLRKNYELKCKEAELKALEEKQRRCLVEWQKVAPLYLADQLKTQIKGIQYEVYFDYFAEGLDQSRFEETFKGFLRERLNLPGLTVHPVIRIKVGQVTQGIRGPTKVKITFDLAIRGLVTNSIYGEVFKTALEVRVSSHSRVTHPEDIQPLIDAAKIDLQACQASELNHDYLLTQACEKIVQQDPQGEGIASLRNASAPTEPEIRFPSAPTHPAYFSPVMSSSAFPEVPRWTPRVTSEASGSTMPTAVAQFL